jgi:hypothetical protein
MRTRALVATLALAAFAAPLVAADRRLSPGDRVPSMFHAEAVTGPRKGKDVCYV